MSGLTLAQLVGLCMHYSGNADKIGVAVGVIMAESSGDPQAKCYNVRDPKDGRVKCRTAGGYPAGPVLSIDRGLCQFNDKYHPEVSDAVAYDPLLAVGAMFHLSGGFVDFHQWGGYTSGNYKRFSANAASAAKDAIAADKGGSPTGAAIGAVGGALVGAGDAAAGAAGGILSAVTSVPEFLGLLSNRHTWVRVLSVFGGAAAVIGGAVLLNKDLAALTPLGGVATAIGHGAASKAAAAAVV